MGVVFCNQWQGPLSERSGGGGCRFGGKVKSYESLIDRARREALLRMKEEAPDASMIINVRIETSTIGKTSRNKTVGCLEAVAYGTALFLEE